MSPNRQVSNGWFGAAEILAPEIDPHVLVDEVRHEGRMDASYWTITGYARPPAMTAATYTPRLVRETLWEEFNQAIDGITAKGWHFAAHPAAEYGGEVTYSGGLIAAQLTVKFVLIEPRS